MLTRQEQLQASNIYHRLLAEGYVIEEYPELEINTLRDYLQEASLSFSKGRNLFRCGKFYIQHGIYDKNWDKWGNSGGETATLKEYNEKEFFKCLNKLIEV